MLLDKPFERKNLFLAVARRVDYQAIASGGIEHIGVDLDKIKDKNCNLNHNYNVFLQIKVLQKCKEKTE